MPYLSASAVVINYEEALYQVYAPLPLPLQANRCSILIGYVTKIAIVMPCTTDTTEMLVIN